MSAIVAIWNEETKTGAIAAESGMSGQVNTRSRPKIRKVGRAYVASSGALSGGQFVEEHSGKWPSFMLSSTDVRHFAAEWRAWCVDRGHTEQEDGLRAYPSNFLILSPHGLFEICTDGGVLHHPPETQCAAIGNGAAVCMGAVHALLSREPGTVDALPGWYESVASYAIEAAIDLCDGCMGPVQVLLLEAQEAPRADPELGAQVLRLIEANDIDRAIKLCTAEDARMGGSQLAMALRVMLIDAHKGGQAIRSALTKCVVPTSEWAAAVAVRDALLALNAH